MSRSAVSIAAIVAVIASPALAADWSGDWGSDMRGSFTDEPKDWAGLGNEDDALGFEVGLRYWYSMGEQSYGSTNGTTSSTDTTQTGELHLRIEDHSSNTFVKGIAGYSFATTGSYEGPLTSGDVVDGVVGYAGADFGWNVIGDNNGSGIGGLVGYMRWNNSPDTGRNSFTTATSGSDISYDPTTGQTFVPGDSVEDQVSVDMLRLGIEGKAKIGDMFDISGELVAVPYAKIGGTVGVDDPMFNTDVYSGSAQVPYQDQYGNVSWMRSSPTSIDGWGYGAMAEAWVGIHPMQNLTFRLGGRAWYLQGTADATFTAAQIGNPGDSEPDGTYDSDPSFVNQGYIETNNPFSLLRYGVLAEMTYAF